MRAAIGLLLLIIGGFLLYELAIGNASSIIANLRGGVAGTSSGTQNNGTPNPIVTSPGNTPQTGGPSSIQQGGTPGQPPGTVLG